MTVTLKRRMRMEMTETVIMMVSRYDIWSYEMTADLTSEDIILTISSSLLTLGSKADLTAWSSGLFLSMGLLYFSLH